jgi:hypothetical protein
MRGRGSVFSVVVTGLVPVIHVFTLLSFSGDKDVDGRVKPGHDEWREKAHGTP